MAIAHGIDHASHLHAGSIPLHLLHESGWDSVLLHHKEGREAFDPFESPNTADLSLAVNGAGQHDIQHFTAGHWRSVTFQPTVAFLIPPGETSRLRYGGRTKPKPFETVHLYLPGSLVGDLMEEYRRIGQRPGPLQTSGFRDAVLCSQVMALVSASRAGAPDLYAAGAAVWLVTHLLSRDAQWQHVAHDLRLSTPMTDRRLARVVEYMSANLDLPVKLTTLAREAGMSIHHFGRRFRERTGMGPAAYLTALRIERAQVLLKTTDLQIADIAFRCGYPRASAFSTAFLRLTGRSPSSYRMATSIAPQGQG